MSKVIKSECGNITILAGDEVENIVHLTESAKEKILTLLKDEEEGSFLRVGVIGGGCSGFQYMFGIHNEYEDGDFVNSNIVVDKISMEYMKGSTLDYIKEISGEYFKVDNPGAISQCGCGTSFNYGYDLDD